MSSNWLSSFNWNYQISNSCVLIDIDPIFKIFKNLLDGSTGLFGARHCQRLKTFVEIRELPKRIIFENIVLIFVNYLESFGGLKVKKNWFWGPLTLQLSPKTMNIMEFQVFPKWNRQVTNPKWSRIILCHDAQARDRAESTGNPFLTRFVSAGIDATCLVFCWNIDVFNPQADSGNLLFVSEILVFLTRGGCCILTFFFSSCVVFTPLNFEYRTVIAENATFFVQGTHPAGWLRYAFPIACVNDLSKLP